MKRPIFSSGLIFFNLTIYQTTKFGTGPNLKFETRFGKGRKHFRKGENAGYQHFLLFPQCFLKISFSAVLKVGIVW